MGDSKVGSLIGQNNGSVIVEGCSFNNTVIHAHTQSGLVIGYSSVAITISNTTQLNCNLENTEDLSNLIIVKLNGCDYKVCDNDNNDGILDKVIILCKPANDGQLIWVTKRNGNNDKYTYQGIECIVWNGGVLFGNGTIQ